MEIINWGILFLLKKILDPFQFAKKLNQLFLKFL
jgi:hypothetical protein